MRDPQAAMYARVSSDQQAHSRTIASQVASLHERIGADGVRLEPEQVFLDEGCSGVSLRRPALERLRDAVAAGAIARIYVHAPDRLARRYAYQVLLSEGFRRAGAEPPLTAEGVIEPDEFQPRIAGLKERLARVRGQQQVLVATAELERGLNLAVGRVEELAAQIHRRLDGLDWQSTREIVRNLVRRIELDGDAVEVVFRVPPLPPHNGPKGASTTWALWTVVPVGDQPLSRDSRSGRRETARRSCAGP